MKHFMAHIFAVGILLFVGASALAVCEAMPGEYNRAYDDCIGMGGAGTGGQVSCSGNPNKLCLVCFYSGSIEIPMETYCSHIDPNRPDVQPRPDLPKRRRRCEGSVVLPERQVLQESIPVVGTPFTLNYSSDRVSGYTVGHRFNIQLAPNNSTYVSHMLSVDVQIDVAGRTITHTDSTVAPFEMYYYDWDGLDSGSSPVYGATSATITLTKNLDSTLPPEIPLVYQVNAFRYNVKKYGLGGWALNIHHFYDPVSKIMYLGNGDTYAAKAKVITGGYMTVSEDGSEAYTFDSNGKHLTTLNGLKGTTKYTFSYTGDVLNSVTDAYSNVTTINHSSGNPTSIVGPYGQTTTLSVDGNGYLDEVINPNSETHTITYTGAGGLIYTFQKPGGVTSTMGYDAYGRLTSDVSSAGASLTLTGTDQGLDDKVMKRSVNVETNEGIDATLDLDFGMGFSQVKVHQSGMNSTTSVFNTTSNNNISNDFDERMPNGHIVRTYYKNSAQFGDLLRIKDDFQILGPWTFRERHYQAVTLSTPSDPFSVTYRKDEYVRNNKTTKVEYSSSTSKYTITNPVTTRLSYVTIDSQEKPTSTQHASFTPVTYSYDANGRLEEKAQGGSRVWEMTYDADGYLASVENPLNQVTSYGYDDAGRVTSVTLPDTRVIAYGYDANGNLTSVTPPSKPAQDMSYNGFDLISEYLNATPTTYDYDDDRRIVQITRPSGATIDYNYHATTGRLTSIVIPTGTITITPSASWNYNTATSSPDGVNQSYTWDGDLLMATANSGATTGSLTMNYNGFWKLHSIKVDSNTTRDMVYDDDALLIEAGTETIARSSTTGFINNITLGSVTEDYTYDSSYGELSGIEAKYSSTNIYKATYTRDALGRIAQKVEKVGAGANQTYDYTYDTAGRLTDVELNSNPLNNYTYDTNGNRLSATYSGVTTNATYTTGDQLIDYGVYDYSYNLNGELDTITDTSSIPSGVTSFTYDALGNLKSVTLASSTTYNYLYDGMNRRVGKKNGSTLVKQFLWIDQLRIAAEYDGAGTLVSEFVYGEKANVPDYMIQGSDKYKIVTDHLGSVVAVVHSSTGTVVQRIAYDEFGRVLSDTNPGFQPFGFAGGLYDPDTGLVRFGARDYDAVTGRWMQKDPILFAGGDTNLYGYVLSDPINSIDPYGKAPKTLDDLIYCRDASLFKNFLKQQEGALKNANITRNSLLRALIAAQNSCPKGDEIEKIQARIRVIDKIIRQVTESIQEKRELCNGL